MKAYISNRKDLSELSIGDKVVRKNHASYGGTVLKIIDIHEADYYFWELIKKENYRENCDKLTFSTGNTEFYVIVDYTSIFLTSDYRFREHNVDFGIYSFKEHPFSEKAYL